MLCGQGNHSTNLRELQGAGRSCAVGLGLGSVPGLWRPFNECNKFSSVLNHNVDAVAALLQYAVPSTLSPLLDKVKSVG